MKHTHLSSPLVRSLLAEADACQEAGHIRTAANYRSAVFKAVCYTRETHSRLPARIDTRWMKTFSCWLARRHAASPGTVSFYLRTLRAVCRRARVYDLSPSDDFRLPRQQASHRALSADELRRLFLPDAADRLSPPMAQTLDVLRFMFCLCGLAFRDVRNLRHDMIDARWHLTCRRSKTGALLQLHVPPEARTILHRYRRPDCPYAFPFLHTDASGKPLKAESALRRLNRHAHALGVRLGLGIPLTTYVMRHTWATLMLEAGKPVELISQCLGHSSIRTTQIYLSQISVHRVETEVEDMLARTIRTSRPNPSRRKPTRRISEDRQPPAESQTGTRLSKRFTPPTKINLSDETNGEEKKCPFLCKKETSESTLPLKGLKSVAKVVRNVIKSKLFSCNLNISSFLTSENAKISE